MRQELLWPAEDLPAALAALAPAAGLSWTIESGEQGDTVPSGDPRTVGVESTAAALGLDVQSAPRGRERAEQKLRSVAPALVPVSDDRVVAVVSAGRRRAVVAAPAGGVVRVPTSELAAAVPREDGASWWLVRSSPGSGFWRQCRQAGVPVRLVLFVAAHAAEYGLFLWSWAVLGRAAFAGDVSDRTLLAWALLLAATVPARVVATRQQAAVAIGAGWLLRRRLLHGTLSSLPTRPGGKGPASCWVDRSRPRRSRTWRSTVGSSACWRRWS